MTPRQIRIARALGRVILPIGASKRRSFIRSLDGIATAHPERALSAAQLLYMLGLCQVYRRQLSDAMLALVDEEHAEISSAGAPPRPARQLPLFR